MQTTFASTPVSAASTLQGFISSDGNVVLHDTTVAAPVVAAPVVATATASPTPTEPNSMSAYAVIENLVIERQVWEDGAYRTSNEQLYVLLQKCYQIYKDMEGTSVQAVALRDALRTYMNLNGLTDNLKNSHTLAKIVKCVFGTTDRRRISAYGIVLRSAHAKSIPAADIPNYIRTAGGVEHLRLAKSPNAKTVTQKASTAASMVKSNVLGVFSSPELAKKLDAGNIGDNLVLLATWQADGSVIVRAAVGNAGVVNAALASYYSANKDAIATATAETAAANDTNAKQEAIAQVVSQSVVNG